MSSSSSSSSSLSGLPVLTDLTMGAHKASLKRNHARRKAFDRTQLGEDDNCQQFIDQAKNTSATTQFKSTEASIMSDIPKQNKSAFFTKGS